MSKFFRFEASFGGIRIDVLSTSTNHGRRVFPHEFPKKSGAATEDKGRRPLIVELEFIFIDRKPQPGEDLPVGEYEERFDDFQRLLQTDEVRTLVHPYLGQIRCRIGEYSDRGDGEGQAQIMASATFTEETTEDTVLDTVSGGIQTTAGSQSVLAASELTNEELATVGLSSSLPDEAFAASESWDLTIGLSTRAVQTEMAALNSRLNDELQTLGAATNANLTPVIRAYTLLQFRLRNAAEAFTTTTPRIIEITVEGTVPLRIIAAEFYGAEEADRRFLEMLELNPQIRTPACIEPGRVLKAFSRTVRPNESRPR